MSEKTEKAQTPMFSEEFSLTLPSINPPDTRESLVSLHNSHQAVFDDEDPVEDKHVPEKSNIAPSRPSPIEKRLLSLSDAEELLDLFRSKAAFFPFVDIPEEATIPSLSRTSPFLLLAILTSSSTRNPKLYPQLDHEFRRVLSSKVIMEGKKSLGFLQGLLIYIAWYPIFITPKNNQSFMYLNLAISLVTDLGLDQESLNLKSFTVFDMTGLCEGGKWTRAAKKCYLGCYYLSSSLSLDFQKPNNLQYTNPMNENSTSFPDDYAPTDFCSLVQLNHLLETISGSRTSTPPAADPHMEALNAELNAQVFQNELQEWTLSVPAEIQNLRLSSRFIRISIYSHNLGFLRRSYRTHPKTTTHPLTSHLQPCLTASKIYFEYLLSLPSSSYHSFTVVQWGSMIQAVIILSRLTFVMARVLGWDANTTRTNVPLGMYLECLCFRFVQLSGTKVERIEDAVEPDGMFVFGMMLGSVKRGYEKRVELIEGGGLDASHSTTLSISRGRCPIFDPTLSSLFKQKDTHFPTNLYHSNFSFPDTTLTTTSLTNSTAFSEEGYDMSVFEEGTGGESIGRGRNGERGGGGYYDIVSTNIYTHLLYNA
ncbi:hypothetical protein HYALB_00006423 [Hymenoscyphus albidus]|uniref:Xylanolytic transcriptional activator regulatory domain-containing protein n=1 Tax=Hymenoscyphus albidus TaxID=595503 RepID=A0A9N9LJ51_9HELO|nr:hypothetical protein HYALB_00006423 [Hymenoscyphus albidus]